MTAPTPLRPDPTDLTPPHGPEHVGCNDSARMARAIGHRALSPEGGLLIDGDFRRWLIVRYAEIADTEHEIGRPDAAAEARRKVERLEAGVSLAELLEAIPLEVEP